MTFAFVLDSVGAGEWFVLLAVLLVVMGPRRLPATARTIGSYYSKFRRAAETFKRQLMDMDWEMERELEKARREAEAALSEPPEAAGGASAGAADGAADDPAAEDGPPPGDEAEDPYLADYPYMSDDDVQGTEPNGDEPAKEP